MTETVPVPAPPAVIPLRFKGELGPMFGIHVVNILLTIVTLGIYRFWAKTRMRRYLWAATTIGDEPLEYTGTGKELLIGILKVVFLVLLPISLAVEFIAFVVGQNSPILADGIRGTASLIFLYLIPVGFYSARRYRLTRTLWRGIRANQSGSAFGYGARAFGSYLLAALTMGLAWPALNLRLNAYKINNTWIGSQRLTFAPGGAGRLYKTFLPVWAIYFVLAIVPGLIAPLVGAAEANVVVPMGPRGSPSSEADVLALIPLLLVIVSSPILLAPFQWYWAAEYRLFAERSQMGDLRFTSTVTGGRLLGLYLGNVLIGFFTLGLGMPIVYRRIARVVERSLTIEGSLNFAALAQDSLDRPKSGEGLADALDVGGF